MSVNASGVIDITTGIGASATVDLTNNHVGEAGNQPITETVADPGFEVQGMSGGLDPTP